MTKWMGMVVLAMAGCGESPAPQPVSSESELTNALKEACSALAMTIESRGNTVDYLADETLRRYQLSYCTEPESELETGNIYPWDYCMKLQRRATDDCLARAAPLIDCLANNPTADPASVCADEWLGEACAPSPFEDLTFAVGGLMTTCSSGGQGYVTTDGTQVGTFTFPASPTVGASEGPVCADGHSYEIQSVLPLTCEMTCTCLLDGVVTKTVTLTDPNFSADRRNIEIEACGWTP